MGIPTGWELVILLAVLVLLFGATKLPTAARSIGQSIRIFKAETQAARSAEQDKSSSSASEQQSLPPAEPVRTAGQQPRRHDDTIR
jgi:sec-independent protein translocase protein TatA